MSFLKGRIRDLYRRDTQECLNYALDYIKDLETAFFTLKQIITFKEKSKLGELLSRTFTLERVANFFPLLIATWIRFRTEKGKLESTLNLIEIIVYRVYAIGRRRADTGIGRLYDLAYKVHRKNLEYDKIIEELTQLVRYYEGDRAFERDLKVENFYNRVAKRDIKYLLFEYERFLREQSREPLDIRLEDILTDKFEIEHIWASDPSKLGLSEDLREIHEQYKNKLGNLTIASRAWNSKWGNNPFNAKRKEYEDSILRVQKELSNPNEWDKEQVEKREGRIICFALGKWKT